MLQVAHPPDTASSFDTALLFNDVYEQFWELLFKISLKKTGSINDATDLVQDVFTHVWENRASLDFKVFNFKSYLITCLYYRIFNWLRSKNLQAKHYKNFESFIANEQILDPLQYNVQEAEAELEAINAVISAAIENMPPAMKRVFVLSWYNNKTIDEIAAELCLSRQTVKNQLSLAVGRFKNQAEICSASGPFTLFILLLNFPPPL